MPCSDDPEAWEGEADTWNTVPEDREKVPDGLTDAGGDTSPDEAPETLGLFEPVPKEEDRE